MSGQECSLNVDDVADLLDEDFEALNKVLEIFSNQFSAKFETRGKRQSHEESGEEKEIGWDDLEAIAYGFGLLPKDFWDLTFHEFQCMQKGINDRIELEQRWEWERVRWLACVNLQPHTKKRTKPNTTKTCQV